MTEPDHVEGLCDIAGCGDIATWAFRDEDTYIEVCLGHSDGLAEQFDSGYEKTTHSSPYRNDPVTVLDHECGSELYVFKIDEDTEYRVCTGCEYALRIEDKGGDKFNVSISR